MTYQIWLISPHKRVSTNANLQRRLKRVFTNGVGTLPTVSTNANLQRRLKLYVFRIRVMKLAESQLMLISKGD